MAKRSLNDLQRQYNSQVATGKKMGMGHGPGGPGMRGGAHGKPKDVGNTVKRLWSYVAAYRRIYAVAYNQQNCACRKS